MLLSTSSSGTTLTIACSVSLRSRNRTNTSADIALSSTRRCLGADFPFACSVNRRRSSARGPQSPDVSTGSKSNPIAVPSVRRNPRSTICTSLLKRYRRPSEPSVPKMLKPDTSNSCATSTLSMRGARRFKQKARGRRGHAFGGHDGEVEPLRDPRLCQQRVEFLLLDEHYTAPAPVRCRRSQVRCAAR